MRVQVHLAMLRSRVAWRTRAVARGARAVPGWDEPVRPVVLSGRQVLELRHARPSDAPARLALRATWGVPGWRPVQGPCVVSSTRVAWLRHCRLVLVATRRGPAQPYLVFLDGALQGQVEVDEVDLGTSSGEVVTWLPGLAVARDVAEPGSPAHESTTDTEPAALAAVALRAFDGPGADVDRLVLPLLE